MSSTPSDALPVTSATPTRTCRDCGAPLERNGNTWVDARSGDDGGTYDLCPERWDEATDTDHGHRPGTPSETGLEGR